MKTKKYYNVEFKLYIETESYNYIDILEKIQKDETIEYAYIIHDKDKLEDGNEVKKHIHLLCFFPSQHSLQAYAKKYGVPEYDIEKIKDRVGAIQYLIHMNNKEKAQYEKENIISNIEDIEKYFNKKIDKENDDIRIIIKFINEYQGLLSLSTLYEFIIKNDIWSTYRRSAYSIISLVREHNELI